MNPIVLSLIHVSFTYESLPVDLFDDLNLQFYTGFTGITGRNGAGKSTFLKLASGVIPPDRGKVKLSGSGYYCSQSTEDVPEGFHDFFHREDAQHVRLCRLLGIQDEWLHCFHQLSHGERKRIQIAIALSLEPDLLALDEPTNHLDQETRAKVISALKLYRGAALIVSHDRELLDEFCDRTLFIDQGRVVLRNGNYSDAKAWEEQENQAVKKEYELLKKEKDRLKREMVRRREIDLKRQASCTKRHLDAGDSDGRAKINLARVTGKDATGGKLLNQLQGRFHHLEQDISKKHYRSEQKTGVTLYTSRSQRDRLWQSVVKELPLGPVRKLLLPPLEILPSQRIALVGPNGSGKSTLITHIRKSLSLADENLIYIPQELDRVESDRMLKTIQELAPEEKGKLLAYFSRLGSAPELLLSSDTPSPGETRKMLLSWGLLSMPELIILDEPTNHLDIISLEALEELLADSVCALLLVSHDQRFLDKLTTQRWQITPGKEVNRLEIPSR